MVHLIKTIEKIMKGSWNGQASLEMTVSLIFVMIFLVASIKIFLWLNETMVHRQQDYEATRSAAASVNFQDEPYPTGNDEVSVSEASLVLDREYVVDESDRSRYPELNLLN